MISFYHTIFKRMLRCLLLPTQFLKAVYANYVAAFLLLLTACASGRGHKPQMTEGTISYPFIADTKPVGRAQRKAPFIIRSAVGASEYSVEIPDNASRYDIQIPLAELRPAGSPDSTTGARHDGKPLNAGTTDKELVGALPSISKSKPNEIAMMDAALGLGSPEGPVQSPSYTLGMARVNDNFRDKNYELALVELNNLIAFYPNSPKLLKMKGTLLVKTGNRDLAMKAWQRAADLAPQDSSLQRSITHLNDRIVMEQVAQTGRVKQEASAAAIDSSFKPIAPGIQNAPIAPAAVAAQPAARPATRQAAALTQQGKPVNQQQAAALTQQGKPVTQQAAASSQKSKSVIQQVAPATQQQLLNAVAH